MSSKEIREEEEYVFAANPNAQRQGTYRQTQGRKIASLHSRHIVDQSDRCQVRCGIPTKGDSLGNQKCQERLVGHRRILPTVAFHSEAEHN